MELLTRQDLVRRVIERWERQYSNTTDARKQEISKRLKTLPMGATADDVEAVIGNSSWTTLKCDVCCSPRDKVLIMDDGYPTNTLAVCELCLERALNRIRR